MIENFVRVRVVVASQSEARFYNATGAAVKMKLIDKLTDPNARLHDRDMVSERSPRKHEAVVFARQVVHQLETEHRKSPFGRLVVMAGPAFLGLLREAMPKALREITVAEVSKDLLHDDDGGVLAHIPREAFEPAFKPYYSAHG